MSLYTVSNIESLPVLDLPKGLTIQESFDTELLASMADISEAEVLNRLENDHSAFVAYIENTPAAFGWMAKGKAKIGELNHEITLPACKRYLWNFRTMEQYRGLGIYPALLQYIIKSERETAKRFWIIHAPENHSSRSGIMKAGFKYVGKLVLSSENMVVIDTNLASVKHQRSLEQMNISLSEAEQASCWNCNSPYLKKRREDCCCAAMGESCSGNKKSILIA
jgi:hypothetical protein